MSFQTLALISLVALLGPLLALPRAWRVPVVVGQLAAGLALGRTGVNRLHAGDATFTFLADLGFALVMFVAGSHVPIRDPKLKSALRIGSVRALAVGACSIAIAVLVAHLFGTGHAALYAVLMASSSAALVLPIIDSLELTGDPVLQLIPQVALADTVCIIALPLAIDSKHVGRAALGATAVLACALVLFLVLRYLGRSGLRQRVHRASEDRQLALELRISLMLLCALAAVASQTHVSVMLAGFSFGLAVSAVGEPRRLARQLFALTEGFLGPLFFVWVGASLDLRQLGHHPKFVLLGLALAAGALASHLAMRASGQPLGIGTLAAAQLGVPVAAVTVGSQLHVLKAGEPAALILAALLSIGVAAVAAGFATGAGRSGKPAPRREHA
ncbi:MAG: cation:proton antiporter [Actinomycetota bacterium]|nr:cation:proton antiporter [Actinomycetota bacterium]